VVTGKAWAHGYEIVAAAYLSSEALGATMARTIDRDGNEKTSELFYLEQIHTYTHDEQI
jgi:hypothetical protein